MFGGGYRVEFGRQGFEIGVLCETMFCVTEISLSLRFKDYFSRTHRRRLCYEIILVYRFYNYSIFTVLPRKVRIVLLLLCYLHLLSHVFRIWIPKEISI